MAMEVPLRTINTSFSIKFFTSLLILSFLFLSQLSANESAHEHGVGALSIAIEGNEVEIELKVPGSDAVGFEHAPSSESERQKVKESAKMLRAIENIVTLSTEANCITKEIEVSSYTVYISTEQLLSFDRFEIVRRCLLNLYL